VTRKPQRTQALLHLGLLQLFNYYAAASGVFSTVLLRWSFPGSDIRFGYRQTLFEHVVAIITGGFGSWG